MPSKMRILQDNAKSTLEDDYVAMALSKGQQRRLKQRGLPQLESLVDLVPKRPRSKLCPSPRELANAIYRAEHPVARLQRKAKAKAAAAVVIVPDIPQIKKYTVMDFNGWV